MGRCKIICSLDGQESAAKLYWQYADSSSRTFPNERYALPVHEFFCIRARGMRWDSEPPRYEIVPDAQRAVQPALRQ